MASAAEVAQDRAAKREAEIRVKCAELRSHMGGLIPGEHARVVDYINRRIDQPLPEDAEPETIKHRHDDLAMLKRRRQEILAEAERRAK